MHALRAPLPDAPPLVRHGLPIYERAESPAAGAHFVREIGGAFYVRLLTLHVRLVTDATVANRTVLVEYRDEADNRYDLSGAEVTQAASSTNDWIFSLTQDQAAWPVDDSILVPLHPLLLLPTHDFRVFVDNIQATDQLSRVRLWYEEFYSASPSDLGLTVG